MQGLRIEENVPLAPLTTFGIGGPARFLARVGSLEELQEALAFAKEKQLKTLILGGGSNVLINDTGFDGLVIKIEMGGVEIQKDQEEKKEKETEENKEKVILIAGAGESWDAVVARSVGEGLWGLENLSGIPGTVGGAVVQNIGAYGAAVSEVLEWVEVVDTEHMGLSTEKEPGAIQRMGAEACAFDYRDSIFKHRNNLVVIRAAFKLSAVPQPNLAYKDLAQKFSRAVGEEDVTHGLATIRETVLEIRRNKFPDLSVEGTAGSFFKNPIVSTEEAHVLQARYPEMPVFEMPETSGVKVPLAWIFDHVLNLKGFSVGGARLFEKQPLVVAARRGASAQDVLTLKEVVEKKVLTETHVHIEPEVKIFF